MKSYDAKDHGEPDQNSGQAKKPWVAPSLDIIALQSAESGRGTVHEGHGALYNRGRS